MSLSIEKTWSFRLSVAGLSDEIVTESSDGKNAEKCGEFDDTVDGRKKIFLQQLKGALLHYRFSIIQGSAGFRKHPQYVAKDTVHGRNPAPPGMTESLE